MYPVFSSLSRAAYAATLRRLPVLAGCCCCLLIPLKGATEDAVKDSEFIPAYQNQILRSHFRSQYYKSVTSIGPRTNDPFVTQYVDRQIAYYLRRIRTSLVMLKVHCVEIREIRENTMMDGRFQTTPEFRKKWRKALGELSRDAKGLKNLIGSILLGLARKDSKRPRVRSVAERDGYRPEVEYIEKELSLAEQKIEDFFYRPTNTVNFMDLRDRKTMLVHLYHVQEMAKRLRAAVGR
jgi:hypothetical protein